MLLKKQQLELDVEQTGPNSKGFCQRFILSSCLYAEYIMRNAGLDEAQAGIKIAHNHKYQ